MMARLPAWVWMSILLFIIASQQATCETFHIILSESANSPCPGELTGEPCITLSQFISGEHRQYTSDPSEIVLEFQPGRHTAGYSSTAFASELVSFTMNSVNSTEIYCAHRQYVINNIQNVYINGIIFRQCSYQIESVMNLTLVDSSFSQVHYRDALYIRSSSAIIKGCNFTNSDYRPLHVGNSSTELHHTMFVNNRHRYAAYSGGAVLVENTQSMTIISHCTFVDNSAHNNGGAIYMAGTNISLFINQSKFTNNRIVRNQASNGGAIYVNGNNNSVSIHWSIIERNRITRGNGGAVHVSGGNSLVSIYQSVIKENTVQYGNGGAVHVSGGNSLVSIYQSVIKENTVQYGNGGAVYILGGSNSSLSLYQTMIDKNNINRGSGGAVHLTGDNGHILIEQSSISNNEARRDSGGAIYANGQSTYISITESTINKNSAVKCGALAFNNGQRYNSVILKNSQFINNSAITRSGGVACIRNASILVQNVTFSHNRAAENAGVFAVDDSEMTVHGSSFDNNTAGTNGGVIGTEYFHISLFISHTSFTNNQGAKQGGVMCLRRKGNHVKISRSTISFNNATKGGFATILGSSLEIATTNIINNTAEAGEVISACNSDISISDRLITIIDPVYSVCTLISGDVNDTFDSEATTTTTEALVDTTTTTDTPTITSRPTPETTTVTMSTTTSPPTEPSMNLSVYFELNGKVYPNSSVILLSEVGENDHALLCKTDLLTCCATPPNRFGEFYYPSGETVLLKKAGHGFYRNRGVQEVRLNRREGVTSPSGKFHCAVPDVSGTIRNLFIHLLSDVISNEQK